jgi:hypothetical protein
VQKSHHRSVIWNQRSVCSLGVYVENDDFGGTLDVSTFSSSFLALFAAFFAFGCLPHFLADRT